MAPRRPPWWQRPFRWLWAVVYNLVGVASQLMLGLLITLVAVLVLVGVGWALGWIFG